MKLSQRVILRDLSKLLENNSINEYIHFIIQNHKIVGHFLPTAKYFGSERSERRLGHHMGDLSQRSWQLITSPFCI